MNLDEDDDYLKLMIAVAKSEGLNVTKGTLLFSIVCPQTTYDGKSHLQAK